MDNSIHHVVLVIECRIPHAHSLKEKRTEIRSLTDRLQNRLNASVAEIARLDDQQHSVIGVSMISNNRRHLQQQVDIVEQIMASVSGMSIDKVTQDWL